MEVDDENPPGVRFQEIGLGVSGDVGVTGETGFDEDDAGEVVNVLSLGRFRLVRKSCHWSAFST